MQNNYDETTATQEILWKAQKGVNLLDKSLPKEKNNAYST